jgi:hypothetical protein
MSPTLTVDLATKIETSILCFFEFTSTHYYFELLYSHCPHMNCQDEKEKQIQIKYYNYKK